MEANETVIFKPAHTPNQNWVKELDPRHMDSTLSAFTPPPNDTRVITLCRPFVVIPKTTYSSPVTLPLGLAYVGAVLDKAGYKTKIIDATGEQQPVKIKRSNNNLYNLQGLTSEEILEKMSKGQKKRFAEHGSHRKGKHHLEISKQKNRLAQEFQNL